MLIIPLEREFRWTRATVSFAVSINLFLYGLSGPFIAGLMDRLGIRRVMVTSLALVATGVALTTLMTASWQLALLWGVVVGLGTGTMASVLGAMVANRWFTERRGVVLGLLTASSATGQLLFLPLLASMVVRLGWRSAVLLVAGVALVVLPLVALLMRDHPRDIGLRPFGEPANAPPTPQPPRAAAAAPLIGLALGLRSRDFWLLAGSFFICGLSTNGLIGTHLIPASMEHGIPEVMAASLLASIGLLDIIGTTVSGWLSDRWDNRYLLCWYYGLRGLSLLFLPYAFGSAYLGLTAFVIFYGLDWVATVPPTARLAADTFGRENVGHHVRLDLRVAPTRRSDGRLRWRPVAYLARRLSGDVHERRPGLLDRGGPRAPHRPGVAPAADAGSGGRRSLSRRVGRSLALAAAVFAALAVPRGALAHARLVGSDPPDLCAGVARAVRRLPLCRWRRGGGAAAGDPPHVQRARATDRARHPRRGAERTTCGAMGERARLDGASAWMWTRPSRGPTW